MVIERSESFCRRRAYQERKLAAGLCPRCGHRPLNKYKTECDVCGDGRRVGYGHVGRPSLKARPRPPAASHRFDARFFDAYRPTATGYAPYEKEPFAGVARLVVAETRARTLLDVGCATGGLIAQLRKLKVKAEGLDVSRYAVGLARAQGLPVTLCDIGRERFPFADETFDATNCWSVLEYLPTIACVLHAMREIERVTSGMIRFSAHFANEDPTYAPPRLVNRRLDRQPPIFWLRLWKRACPKLGTRLFIPDVPNLVGQ